MHNFNNITPGLTADCALEACLNISIFAVKLKNLIMFKVFANKGRGRGKSAITGRLWALVYQEN
jgi:hypothetical protein